MLAAPSYTKTVSLPSLPQWIDTGAAVRDKRVRSLLFHTRTLPAQSLASPFLRPMEALKSIGDALTKEIEKRRYLVERSGAIQAASE